MKTINETNKLPPGSRLERVLAVALILAVLMNVVNVAARYWLGEVITGIDELQVYLMVALAFLGSVVAQLRRQHLRMDVLTRYFPAILRRLVDYVESGLSLLLYAFVCAISWHYVWQMVELGSHSENAHVPMWIPHSIVASAFAAMALIALKALWASPGNAGTTAILQEPAQ